MNVTSISTNQTKFSYVTIAWWWKKKQKYEVIGDAVKNNELLVVIIKFIWSVRYCISLAKYMIIVVTQLHVVLYMVRSASVKIYACICDTCCSSSLSSLVYRIAFYESLE